MEALVSHVRDVRDGGSDACALAGVAAGRLDAYWGPRLHVWDAAAGMLLVDEAGGATGSLSGGGLNDWADTGDVLAANHELWRQLSGRLRPVYET
jgi:myo-inositol-1(or 4)-monophosphatase